MTLSDLGPELRDAPRLVELDPGTCLLLLARCDVGRIVYTDGAMPAAHPVTYLLDETEAVFRIAAGATLTAVRDNVVAFQADRIDHNRRTGWSVLGVGHAYEVLDAGRIADLDGRLPPPWGFVPAGPPPAPVVAVPLQHLTGRWLRSPARRA